MRAQVAGTVAAVLGLCAIDACFSLHFAGGFVEANPALAPLLGEPVRFLAVKHAMLAAGLAVLAAGRGAPVSRGLVATGAIYAVIDGYWVGRWLIEWRAS